VSGRIWQSLLLIYCKFEIIGCHIKLEWKAFSSKVFAKSCKILSIA
jgi:hypothetical protein